jgi:dTDP-4-amino-4,6-dideoxygalactose transaminase
MNGRRPVPLSEPDLRGREEEYLSQCVRDNWVSSAGPFVTEFERRIAEHAGKTHTVAISSGTAALHLSLLCAGIGPGDLVAVPDWTFAASANAIRHAGATPYFLDVSESDWAIDPQLLREVLGSERRIRAVIAVDPLGHAADMDALQNACDFSGAILIEDAAGAIGATYRGRPCGGLGDLGIFSFNGNKTVTAGGGGMIATNNAALASRARSLSSQARSGAEYSHDAVGFNYRMTNLNAAVGLAQMERLEEMVAAKRGIAARYDAALDGRPDMVPMPRPASGESSCWLYSVRLPSEQRAHELVHALAAEAIEARIFWRSLSAQAPYAGAPRKLRGVSAALSGTVVSLPCSSGLSAADQDRVIAGLRSVASIPMTA